MGPATLRRKQGQGSACMWWWHRLVSRPVCVGHMREVLDTYRVQVPLCKTAVSLHFPEGWGRQQSKATPLFHTGVGIIVG